MFVFLYFVVIVCGWWSLFLFVFRCGVFVFFYDVGCLFYLFLLVVVFVVRLYFFCLWCCLCCWYLCFFRECFFLSFACECYLLCVVVVCWLVVLRFIVFVFFCFCLRSSFFAFCFPARCRGSVTQRGPRETFFPRRGEGGGVGDAERPAGNSFPAPRGRPTAIPLPSHCHVAPAMLKIKEEEREEQRKKKGRKNGRTKRKNKKEEKGEEKGRKGVEKGGRQREERNELKKE